MDEPPSRRIVLLGKTGAGKSSLANTILGDNVFKISHYPTSETNVSRAESRRVRGRNLTLIDACSFFDTCGSESWLKKEIVRCITECAPGPHAFLIVLKVEKFTVQEKDVISKICQHFSEDALKFSAVVFTHGDQLQEGTTIEDFVRQNEGLRELVKKCGGRCHVVDNKYWKSDTEDPYRNNQVQVAEILKTTDQISEENGGRCYTNETLEKVKKDIQQEEKSLRQTEMSAEEIRNKAKNNVSDRLLITLAGTATGAVLGAFLGVVKEVPALAGSSSVTGQATWKLVNAALSGGIKGGQIGYEASTEAESPMDALEKAKDAVRKDSAF